MKPRAAASAPAAGWPARSTSIVPSRNNTSLMTAYEVAFAASGLATTWIAPRPLYVVCAIDTFFPASRSTLWAASGMTSSADKYAHVTDTAEGKQLFIFGSPGSTSLRISRKATKLELIKPYAHAGTGILGKFHPTMTIYGIAVPNMERAYLTHS